LKVMSKIQTLSRMLFPSTVGGAHKKVLYCWKQLNLFLFLYTLAIFNA